MKRHKWKPFPYGDIRDLTHSERRKCERCGFVQTKNPETWYMRTIGYHWYPEAGECKEPQP